ncbi:MAG TPA: hypothetical protein VF407_19720, partial [Polyangiaceae bacterium]
QVSSAHREVAPDGEIRAHRAWHDLTADERVLAHDETDRLRALERATGMDGLTSTARAVLARIRRA